MGKGALASSQSSGGCIISKRHAAKHEMDQYGPIYDGCVGFLAANAMFRRSSRIDTKVLGLLLGVEILQSIALQGGALSPDPLIMALPLSLYLGYRPRPPLYRLALCAPHVPSWAHACPSLERFLWAPMPATTTDREMFTNPTRNVLGGV